MSVIVLNMFNVVTVCNSGTMNWDLMCVSEIQVEKVLGPVVQSVVSLTSSLRVISLNVLVESIYNILIFFAEKNVSSFCTAKATHIFSAN